MALAVHPTHDRIETGDGRDDVGDEATFATRGHRLQIGERRVAHVHAVRPGAAVGHQVAAQLPAGGLDGDVHLAGRDAETFGAELEVMDHCLHRLAHDVPDVVERI